MNDPFRGRIKIRTHYVGRNGLISLNPNFGVNRSIWGIWGSIRIIRTWGLIRSFRVSKLKIWPHFVLRSGLINLNPNFGVNRSIWGIWGFIRIIRAWGLIRSFTDFEIQNSGRTMTGATVKLA